MIPTDLLRSSISLHSAGRKQGDGDERYSAAVDRDGTGLGSFIGSRLEQVGVARVAC